MQQFTYDSPPAGEIQFAFSAGAIYRRDVLRCLACGHFISRHEMDATELYTGDYVSSVYGADGLRQAFARITALDPSRSDNIGRVRRINAFATQHFGGELPTPRTVLDVGCGLGVFVHRMSECGWVCTAVDPDIRAVEHARELGATGIHGDFLMLHAMGRFTTVTFNKVLEHVADPIAMLVKARECLERGGCIYVEVPDGELASMAGPAREEFFIDHLHVFSAASLAVMGARAALTAQVIERLREPSGKYTLRGFFTPAPSADRAAA